MPYLAYRIRRTKMRMGWFNGRLCFQPHTRKESAMLDCLLETLRNNTLFEIVREDDDRHFQPSNASSDLWDDSDGI